MSRFSELLDHIGAEPFRPFEIRLNDGKAFAVRHADQVQVGRSTFSAFAPSETDPNRLKRFDQLPLAAIESIGPITEAKTEALPMRPADILRYVNEMPFRPFRIHMVTGKTYDIRHPTSGDGEGHAFLHPHILVCVGQSADFRPLGNGVPRPDP